MLEKYLSKPVQDESDPDKTIEEMLGDQLQVFDDSHTCLSQHWKQFYDEHYGKFIALRYRYGANPPYFVEFGRTHDGLLRKVAVKYPQTFIMFARAHLVPPRAVACAAHGT